MTKSSIDWGYPTPADGPVPVFHSIDEEGAWWDTHNADGSELEPEELVEDYREDGSFRIRLNADELRELTEEAKRLRMGASVLAGKLLKERLRELSKRLA